MNRRHFLLTGTGVAVGLSAPWMLRHSSRATAGSKTDDGEADVESLQANWQDFAPAGLSPITPDTPLATSEDEWREQLAPAAFQVLFEDATERAGSSPLDREKRAGLFVCAACELPLFTSAMKYDSRTGWPSFFTAIPEHLATSRDFKLVLPRTEYHCARCGGHQGHLFTDGPAPTGERWCNNGVALTFLPA